MRVRRDILSLNVNEQKQLIDAFLRLKKNGKYDAIVAEHKRAMMRPTPMQGEKPDHGRRNAAHRGPIFLPWHREYLLRLEKELGTTLPYWDWTVDAAMPDPTKSDVWGTDLMGGNGVAGDWWVAAGSFANSAGDWDIPNNLDGPALMRRFGAYPGHSDQATKADVALAFSDRVYDQPPWDRNAALFSFRNRIEGWVSKTHDPRIRTSGSQTHNRIHLWVGGQWTKNGKPVNGSMVRSTSRTIQYSSCITPL